MSQCTLHIGMHKTGTTSIQKTLQRLTPSPQDQYQYATFQKNANHSAALESLFSPQPEKTDYNRKAGLNGKSLRTTNQKTLQQLTQFLEKNKGKNILFSGEGIAHFDRATLVNLKTFLSPFFTEIKIIAYIREPLPYMNSAFQQRIRSNYLNPKSLRFPPRKTYPNYRKTFTPFLEIFGENNVTLLPFLREQLRNACTVQDICHELGIHLPQNSIIRSNARFSHEAIAMLYTFRMGNTHPKTGHQAIRDADIQLVKLLKQLPGATFSIPSQHLIPLLQRRHNDIQWMRNHLSRPANQWGKHATSETAQACTNSDLFRVETKSCLQLSHLFTQQTKQQLKTLPPMTDTAEPTLPPETVTKLLNEIREYYLAEQRSPKSWFKRVTHHLSR